MDGCFSYRDCAYGIHSVRRQQKENEIFKPPIAGTLLVGPSLGLPLFCFFDNYTWRKTF